MTDDRYERRLFQVSFPCISLSAGWHSWDPGEAQLRWGQLCRTCSHVCQNKWLQEACVSWLGDGGGCRGRKDSVDIFYNSRDYPLARREVRKGNDGFIDVGRTESLALVPVLLCGLWCLFNWLPCSASVLILRFWHHVDSVETIVDVITVGKKEYVGRILDLDSETGILSWWRQSRRHAAGRRETNNYVSIDLKWGPRKHKVYTSGHTWQCKFLPAFICNSGNEVDQEVTCLLTVALFPEARTGRWRKVFNASCRQTQQQRI